MSTEYTVFYFPVLGRGEIIRLLLECGGAKYENKAPKNWPEEKSKTPFGQLPVLIIKEDGKEHQLAQSSAIARYLARKFGFYPENDIEKAIMESYTENLNDFSEKIVRIAYVLPEDQRDEGKKEFKSKVVPAFIELQTRILKNNKSSGYFIGTKTTLADITLFNTIDVVNAFIHDTLTAQNAPELMKVYEQVAKYPKIVSYLASTRRFAK